MQSRASRCLLVPLLVFPFVVAARQPSQGRTVPSQTVLRSTTRLVQVSVIVQNKSGQPILGLKKSDFTLLDGGRPQQIAFLNADNAGAAGSPRALPSNVFTNRFDLNGQAPGSVTILLFDALNTDLADQIFVRARILKFLKTLAPQDHIALYALTSRLVILQDFTADSSALAGAVKNFRPDDSATYDASHPEPFEVPALRDDPMWMRFQNAVNNANDVVAEESTVNRVALTTAAIEAIADHVAGIPGRKSLVWVSDGVPIAIGADKIGLPDHQAVTFAGSDSGSGGGAAHPSRDFTGAARALNRANLAIYPVDAHGLEPDAIGSLGNSFNERQSRRDTFRLLADRTGGKAFYGTNDIGGAVHEAFEDGRYTYTLGYYPNHGAWDGRFREIRLQVHARGARLRYRRGYYAMPDSAKGEVVAASELRDAALSPLDATNLGVIVVGKVLAAPQARDLLLQITISPAQLLLHSSDGRRQGGLDLLFLQRDTAGKFLAAERQHFEVDLTSKDYALMTKVGLVLERKLKIVGGAAGIRIVVRDSASGALGSVTLPARAFLPQ